MGAQPTPRRGARRAKLQTRGVGRATLLPPLKTEERGSDWNDFATSRDSETFMPELRGGFAIA